MKSCMNVLPHFALNKKEKFKIVLIKIVSDVPLCITKYHKRLCLL